MAFGYDDALFAAIIGADFIYHRWFSDPPAVQSADPVTVPTAQPGAIVPLVWGRYRVNKPLLAWTGKPSAVLCSDIARFADRSGYLYMLDQFFNMCIPFEGGQHRLKSMWLGDVELGQNGDLDSPGLGVLPGDGTGGDPDGGELFVTNQDDAIIGQDVIEGNIEFLNGADDQALTFDDHVTGSRWVGSGMLTAGVDGTLIPGYRGYLSAYLFHRFDPDEGIGLGTPSFVFGTSSSLPSVSFEIATYAKPSNSFYLQVADFFGGGIDANPIDVIYDVLIGKFGKLRIDPSRIDTASFTAAAKTCYDDGIGYSMAYEDATTAADIIGDILKQIDGIIYENPNDGKIYIKLVRQDYDPGLVRLLAPHVGVSKIENFAAGGWTGLPNKVTVAYMDRSQSYVQNTVSGMGDANAAAMQDTEVSEILLTFLGCCTGPMAQIIANREIAALCRPIAKFEAICDQRWADVNPGDVLAVTWPKLQMSRAMFRVAASNRGAASDGQIRLSLIQEYFQTYRGAVPPWGGIVPSFPTHSLG